jgi:hypothetical protein
MSYQLDGRPVSQLELAGVDRRNPDACDAHLGSAVWGDTGEALSEEDLERLDSDDLVGELLQEHLQGQADNLHDLLTDR